MAPIPIDVGNYGENIKFITASSVYFHMGKQKAVFFYGNSTHRKILCHASDVCFLCPEGITNLCGT